MNPKLMEAPLVLPASTPRQVGPHPTLWILVRSPESNGRFYRPELDVLRFFAFFAVFIHHGLPGFEPKNHHGFVLAVLAFVTVLKQAGGFGVCLFFVLSAYLITELLNRERARTGGIDIPAFYIRRILRIWPLYFVFLFFAVVLGRFVPSYGVEWSRLLSFLFFAGNWYVVVTNCGANPIAPLWSISLEEQFYLTWPWLAGYCTRRFVLVLSSALFPLAWLMLLILSKLGCNPDRTIWVNSLVQFQFFGLGALLALKVPGSFAIVRRYERVVLLVIGAAAWLIAAAVFRVKNTIHPPTAMGLIAGYTLVAVGCALFFFAFFNSATRFPQAITYLGRISYGLYVFHMVAIEYAWKAAHGTVRSQPHATGSSLWAALVPVLGFIGTTGAAMLSYRYLERPFLNLKKRFTVIQSRAI